MWEIFFDEVLFWEVTRSFTEGFAHVYVLMLIQCFVF